MGLPSYRSHRANRIPRIHSAGASSAWSGLDEGRGTSRRSKTTIHLHLPWKEVLSKERHLEDVFPRRPTTPQSVFK